MTAIDPAKEAARLDALARGIASQPQTGDTQARLAKVLAMRDTYADLAAREALRLERWTSHPVPAKAMTPPTFALTSGGKAATDTIATSSAVAAPALSAVVAAAAASATVPVVGWVVAAVLGVAAGTIALVRARGDAEARQAQAIAWARRANVPTTDPAFLVRVLTETEADLRRTLEALAREPAGQGDRIRQARAAFAARFGASAGL